MKTLPSLDARAHLDPSRLSDELTAAGAVLAMTTSLDEAALVVDRHEPHVTWGVGCHPRRRDAQESFDLERFVCLVEQTAIVGEIGLDTGSRVPLELQLRNFRQALEVVSGLSRVVSIHSYRATAQVLEELRRTPIALVDGEGRRNIGSRSPWVLLLYTLSRGSTLEVSYAGPFPARTG
jgi:TatD DNase family protein